MKILIVAGPTREYIDSVRYLSNPSSGYMGICLAKKAIERKWEVSLILGPTHLEPPKKVFTIRVVSTLDMNNAVQEMISFRKPEGVIMCAAPCDFQPEKKVEGKIKKEGKKDGMNLKLLRTPDILAGLGAMDSPPLLCGFALEHDSPLEYGKKKLKEKNLDMIVVNTLKSFSSASIFEGTFLFRDGKEESLGNMDKEKLADLILDKMDIM